MKSKLVTKRVNMKVAGLLASSLFAVGVLTGATSPTSAVTIDFSFSNTFVSNGGAATAVPGTVTGEIVGLTDNATSAASAVIGDGGEMLGLLLASGGLLLLGWWRRRRSADPSAQSAHVGLWQRLQNNRDL